VPGTPTILRLISRRLSPLEKALALLDANSVCGALLDVLPAYRRPLSDGVWEYDNSYAEEAIGAHPGRFCSTLRLDPLHPEIEALVGRAAARPNILALRVVFRFPHQVAAYEAGHYDRLFAQAERSSLPVMLFVTGHLDKAAKIASDFPANLFIVDHLGLPQHPRTVDEPPFKALPALLGLASHCNVAVKCIGAPALSRLFFPYQDVREPLLRIIDAFGVSRVMWGSDYTRLRHLSTYSELIGFLREGFGLTYGELAMLQGNSLRHLLDRPDSEGYVA
jgi:L-fuconolactonase